MTAASSPRKRTRTVAVAGSVLALTLGAAACGGSSNSNNNTSGGSTTSGSASAPQMSASSFSSDFSAMAELKSLAAKGKGKIGVLLPDTTTSARYVTFDAPYLTKAFEAAGLTNADFKIDNAHGSASTMQTQAEADITAGASVLLVDALDSGSGAAIEANAASHGVKVIDYDRLVKGGQADRTYVSFDNVKVGQLIGQGEVSCINDWSVKKPHILIMDGDPTDNNAKLFAQGYNGVLKPYFDKGTYTKVGEPAGTWTPSVAQTTFAQQYTAHPEHQRGGDPQRRQRQRGDRLPAEQERAGQDLPDHRSGRVAVRSAEHPQGLPVRHRLQADLPGGAGGRGRRDLPAGR